MSIDTLIADVEGIGAWVSANVIGPALENATGWYQSLGLHFLFEAGVSDSVLASINAVGIGLLSAGITLRNSPLANGVNGPTAPDGRSLKQLKNATDMKNALFLSMMLFGSLCVISTLIQLLERVRGNCTRTCDTDALIYASDITTLGLTAAVVLFFHRAMPAILRSFALLRSPRRSGFVPEPIS